MAADVRPRLRTAVRGDATALADLHTRSWRSAYRGILSDDYLDGAIEADRRNVWRDRYERQPPGLWTALAEQADGSLAGFVCLLVDHDPARGTLVDNLHVDPGETGRGIGRLLMRTAGGHLRDLRNEAPVHLTVFEANVGAIGFYERVGGQRVERIWETEPDGRVHPILRYAWRSPTALLDGVGAAP